MMGPATLPIISWAIDSTMVSAPHFGPTAKLLLPSSLIGRKGKKPALKKPLGEWWSIQTSVGPTSGSLPSLSIQTLGPSASAKRRQRIRLINVHRRIFWKYLTVNWRVQIRLLWLINRSFDNTYYCWRSNSLTDVMANGTRENFPIMFSLSGIPFIFDFLFYFI